MEADRWQRLACARLSRTLGRSPHNLAVAWLMGIGNGRWIVRFRNKASKPMKLPAARKYALELVRGIRPGRVMVDPIGDLNRMRAVLAEYEAINKGGDL